MASNSGSIDKIFEEIINDAENTAKNAIKSASKNVQKDIIDKAKDDLNYYYANYKPKIYRRQDKLRRAILPYYADRSNSKNISIEIGVQYKSSALTGAYKSNSWYHQNGDKWISRSDDGFNWKGQNNGIPESDWIFENFIEGIHPITGKDYTYSEKKDPKSQEELMIEFLETELPDKIDSYIMGAVINVINSKLG